jgi:hypothetical protein
VATFSEAAMSKTKLKDRSRYPCGKLKPETASPALIRRILTAAKRDASDPLLGSEIGRLRLNDVLDDTQAAAATRFASIVGTYDRVKGVPRRTAASPSYEIGFGGRGGDHDAHDDEVIAALAAGVGVMDVARNSPRTKALLRAERRYTDAMASLRFAGRTAELAVLAVAVRDEMVVVGHHPDLAAGLQALAGSFGLVPAVSLTKR